MYVEERTSSTTRTKAWQCKLKHLSLTERQETRLMKCAPFFVARLKKMLKA